MSGGEKLGHYLTAWNLSDPHPLAQTRTSQLYTVSCEGETRVLKLLTQYGWEERRGAAALRYYGGRGAVRLYQSDPDAQLLEYASGEELIALVERGEDEAATRIVAGVLEQLHGVRQETPRDGLVPLRDWFRELFKRAESDRVAGVASIYVRGADVAERLLSDPRDERVLHGDIHHRNIRRSSRGWLAFDPKGVFGERTYDCANTLCNPFRGTPRYDELVHDDGRLMTHAAILADALEIDLRRVLEFTFGYACLSASWSLAIDDLDAAQWALNVGAIVEPHLALAKR